MVAEGWAIISLLDVLLLICRRLYYEYRILGIYLKTYGKQSMRQPDDFFSPKYAVLGTGFRWFFVAIAVGLPVVGFGHSDQGLSQHWRLGGRPDFCHKGPRRRECGPRCASCPPSHRDIQGEQFGRQN